MHLAFGLLWACVAVLLTFPWMVRQMRQFVPLESGEDGSPETTDERAMSVGETGGGAA